MPFDGRANEGKRSLDEFTNCVGLVGSQDIVVGFVHLQHAPHTYRGGVGRVLKGVLRVCVEGVC